MLQDAVSNFTTVQVALTYHCRVLMTTVGVKGWRQNYAGAEWRSVERFTLRLF